MNELLPFALRVAPFVLLVGLRVAVVLALMPAPFGDVAPTRVRAALSMLIAFALCLPLLGSAPEIPLLIEPLIVAGMGELFVGAVIGLTARVMLAAAEIAGTLMGNAMGLGFATQIDPLFGQESLPTTTLLSSLGVLIFFGLSGHHTLVQALAFSLHAAPCGQALSHASAEAFLMLGSRMVAQGLRIGSPVVATMFIVQLGTALVARAAPRVQVFGLSFGVTITVGVWVLFSAAPQLALSIGASLSSLQAAISLGFLGGAR